MTTRPTYAQYTRNNATTTLTVELTTGQTSMTVTDASLFELGSGPSATFTAFATIDDGANIEIVQLTNVAGNVVTIVRAQESTSSPASFAIGTTVEMRTTAGYFDYLDPLRGGYSGTISIGTSAETDETNAIAIGAAAIGGDTVGSGLHDGQIAIGAGAQALKNGSVAIGLNARATAADNNIAIGEDARASGDRAIYIGEGNGTTNITSGTAGTSVGPFVTNSGANSTAIGSITVITADDAVAVGANAEVNSTAGIAIGKDSIVNTTSQFSVAIGEGAIVAAATQQAVALGVDAKVGGQGAIAIGQLSNSGNANGGTQNIVIGASAASDVAGVNDSVCIGGGARTLAIGSVAMGLFCENYAAGSFRSGGPRVVQRMANWFYNETEVSPMLGGVSIISSPPVDLGPGVAWSGTTFLDGEVCEPTSPVGTEQFYMQIDRGATSYYNADPTTTNSITEIGSVEPTWDIAAQGNDTPAEVSTDNGWYYVDPEVGITILANAISFEGAGGVLFYPTRAAFICQKFAAMTAEPFISIGNQVSTTAYVNNQQLTSITSSTSTQWFDITDGDGAEKIVFTLETRGTVSGTCQGRFIIEGIYMQTMG